MGYDPFGFASVEGYKYYFPALAKMAFDPNPNEEWFGGQLIFHLTNNGKQNRFLNAFDNEQRKAVVASLLHLQNSVELEKEPWLKEELVEAIELWSA